VRPASLTQFHGVPFFGRLGPSSAFICQPGRIFTFEEFPANLRTILFHMAGNSMRDISGEGPHRIIASPFFHILRHIPSPRSRHFTFALSPPSSSNRLSFTYSPESIILFLVFLWNLGPASKSIFGVNPLVLVKAYEDN